MKGGTTAEKSVFASVHRGQAGDSTHAGHRYKFGGGFGVPRREASFPRAKTAGPPRSDVVYGPLGSTHRRGANDDVQGDPNGPRLRGNRRMPRSVRASEGAIPSTRLNKTHDASHGTERVPPFPELAMPYLGSLPSERSVASEKSLTSFGSSSSSVFGVHGGAGGKSRGSGKARAEVSFLSDRPGNGFLPRASMPDMRFSIPPPTIPVAPDGDRGGDRAQHRRWPTLPTFPGADVEGGGFLPGLDRLESGGAGGGAEAPTAGRLPQPPASRMPGSRADVQVVREWLAEAIGAYNACVEAMDVEERIARAPEDGSGDAGVYEVVRGGLKIYTRAMTEVARQVTLHCRERGELLSLIWNDHAAVLAGLVDKLERLWEASKRAAREARESAEAMKREVDEERRKLEASHALKEEELIRMEGIVEELRTKARRGGGDNRPRSVSLRTGEASPEQIITPMSDSKSDDDGDLQGFQAYNVPHGMAVVLVPKEDIEDLQESFRVNAKRRTETVEKLQEVTVRGRRENRAVNEDLDKMISTISKWTGANFSAAEDIKNIKESAAKLPGRLEEVKSALKQQRVQIDALEFELLKFDNDLNMSNRRHQLAEVRANELEARLRPMTPRPPRDFAGMREDLPPEDFDVLQGAVDRYDTLHPRSVTNILLGRAFGGRGQNLAFWKSTWGKLKRNRINVAPNVAVAAIERPDPHAAIDKLAPHLTPDISNFLRHCVQDKVDIVTAGYLLEGVVEGVEVKSDDWGALDGKVDARDLERVITCAMRRTNQRLRDAEAHAQDLLAEVEVIRQQASQMAPVEERKKMVLDKRNNVKKNKKKRLGTSDVADFLERPWTDHFIGIGTGEHVPRILRFTGKIRNKGLTKMECEKKVQEIWSAKILEDKRNGGSTQDMQDFVYDFFKERTPGPISGVIETGYNFIHSLKRFDYDPDCEMFLLVFLNELSEDVYKDQLRLVFDVNKLFFIMEALHGENGRISKKVIRLAIRAYFGDQKTEDRIQEVIKAIDEDCPGTHAEWSKLFAEDMTTYTQSHFVEKIRTQMLDERMEYFQNLEDVLYTLTGWKEECTKVQIQNAVMQLDITGQMQMEEAVWIVSKGLQGGGLREKDMTVSKVMAKLRKGVSLVMKKRSDSDDPLMNGKKPGDGIPKPENAPAATAGQNWKNAFKSAKKLIVPKEPSPLVLAKLVRELKNLSPAFTAAVAAIKAMP